MFICLWDETHEYVGQVVPKRRRSEHGELCARRPPVVPLCPVVIFFECHTTHAGAREGDQTSGKNTGVTTTQTCYDLTNITCQFLTVEPSLSVALNARNLWQRGGTTTTSSHPLGRSSSSSLSLSSTLALLLSLLILLLSLILLLLILLLLLLLLSLLPVGGPGPARKPRPRASVRGSN